MSCPWFQEFWRFILLMLIMVVAGLVAGHPLLFLFTGCLVYLSWHLYNLHRLCYWFAKSKKLEPPDAPGIWGEVFHNFHRLQQRNRKRKRKLALILNNFQRSTAAMPDAAVILGSNYEITWFNKAAGQLLGLISRQDTGQPITNLIRYPAFLAYLTNTNEDAEDSIKIPSPADSEIILRVHIVPYAKNQHLLLARDITRIHRLEQMRRDFVANISHELRTPLTVLTGFVETMRDADDENLQQWQRPLMLMEQQTMRIRRLVDDLLLLSRLESEPESGNKELIPVAKMLAMICEEARLLSGKQNHQIVLEADELLCIYGYNEELRSAFTNLLSNAVRYTPTGGNIKVRWYQDEQGVHCEVQDDGEGIPPEHLPRLTERFYRVDVGRSRVYGGTGLGLTIVKHVLNRHGAQLHIESTVGEGSVFRCNFPPLENRIIV